MVARGGFSRWAMLKSDGHGQWRLLALTMTLGAALMVASGAWLPAKAGAEATVAPPSIAGPPGLPDGRVYEQVSPTNKYGNEAGGPLLGGEETYVVAGSNGNEAMFQDTGTVGETPSGLEPYSVARRTAAGWLSHGAVSRGFGEEGAQYLLYSEPTKALGASADLSVTLFGSEDTYVPNQPNELVTPHLYRYSEDGTVAWIGEPTISNPMRLKGTYPEELGDGVGRFAGGSANLGTVYFDFDGTLTPQDNARNPLLGNLSRSELMQTETAPLSDKGFYEWKEGALSTAGVLPSGYLDPYGAVPAATANASEIFAESLDNQVADEGKRAFFVSPDPKAGAERPSELYVRETAEDGTQSTVLVSQDTLLPQEGGLPVAAPHGVVDGVGFVSPETSGGSYMYASSDGSHVFFESVDQLTADAPSGGGVYDFNTVSNTLSFLPGVAVEPERLTILASSRDGSRFFFEAGEELKMWSGGQVTPITRLGGRRKELSHVRTTLGGSVLVFQTSFALSGFNNGGFQQIYRYDAGENSLSCVSCPPVGVTPTSNAKLTHQSTLLTQTFTSGTRGISEDGSRVFFDTSDALVPQDTNGVRDVYEWENGIVYLISSGTSIQNSYAGDNSPNGNDVFFGTADNLAPGDTDGGYDVYDARVPRPGDVLPAKAVPCQGDVCQGPPSVPSPLGAPASATFFGSGNPASPASNPVKHKAPKKKAKSKRKAKHKKKRGKAAKPSSGKRSNGRKK